MPTIRSDLPALVLDSIDHGESDKIVTFFCQDIGKLTAIAKGAHRSKKRFLNKLELFTFLQISYSKSSPASLSVLTEAELLNSFISLRSNLPCYRTASIIREFMLLATGETINDDNVFKLALWTLHSLDRGDNPKRVLALFLVKLFDFIGYRPDFASCQGCGKEPGNGNPATFSVQTGGLVCRECMAQAPNSTRILTPGTTHMIRAIQQQPISRLNRFKPGGIVLKQILDCFYRYGRHLFQREIHSWKSMDC